MKRILLFASILLLTVSCGRNSGEFVVKGTITDSLATAPGAKIVFTLADGAEESVPIENGKFTFKGKADLEKHYHVTLGFDETMPFRHNHQADFIAEAGTIRINLDNPPKVRGGKFNKALSDYLGDMDELINAYNEHAMALIEKIGKSAAMERIIAMQDSVTEVINTRSLEVFRSNPDNVLGAMALSNVIYDITPDELDECLGMAADFIKENPDIQRIKASKDAYRATSEGSMFSDFAGRDISGREIKLSDFVGKGKYTLVDFWASWCGPCKAEIPNIKAVADKWSHKGLNVVSVAVWDRDEASRTVIDELGMDWSQILTEGESSAAESYGIDAIPHLILFAPDGRILKRGLRGEMIDEAVEEALKTGQAL